MVRIGMVTGLSPGQYDATRWDFIRRKPTVIDNMHESLYRAHSILDEVKNMLARGDSVETITAFIAWCESVDPEQTDG